MRRRLLTSDIGEIWKLLKAENDEEGEEQSGTGAKASGPAAGGAVSYTRADICEVSDSSLSSRINAIAESVMGFCRAACCLLGCVMRCAQSSLT